MVTYLTDDGQRYQAKRSRDLVNQMRSDSWSSLSCSRSKWMRDVAKRAQTVTGRHVRSNTDANFVRDLVEIGLLRREDRFTPDASFPCPAKEK